MDDDDDAYCGAASIMIHNSSQRRTSAGKCEGMGCLPPRFLLSRWFNGQKSKFRSNFGERRKGKHEVSGKFDGKSKNKVVMGAINGESSSSSTPEESGQHKEVSFNSGLGFGLIYLLIASKNELNKIIDLHKEMDMLLQSFRDRLQNHPEDDEELSVPSKQNKVISPTNSDGYGVVHSKGRVSFQEFPSSNYLEDPKSHISRQQSRKKMDILEAELEAELEHLQLQLDTELMFYPTQQYTEITVEDSEAEGEGSIHSSFREEIIGPLQVNYEEQQQQQQQNGVSPSELERRLHEVLEARQQERINELELALHKTTQKIHNLERELSWWKDTAKLFFHHVPVTSHL